MSEVFQFSLYILMLSFGLIMGIVHNKLYNVLIKKLETKNGPIWEKYEDQGRNPLSSSGAIPRIKYIEEKFKHSLTDDEKKIIKMSRFFYYFGGLWTISVFIIFIFVIFRR